MKVDDLTIEVKMETLGLIKELEELQYLRSFYSLVDFGPSDESVRESINEEIREQGIKIPEDYQ